MDGITSVSSTPASTVTASSAAPIDKKGVAQQGTDKKSGAIQAPVDEKGRSDGRPKPSVDKTALEKAMEKARQAVEGTKDKVSFDFDKSKGQLYVKVTDAETGRVVQTFPAGAIADHAAVANGMHGLLLDRKG